MAKSIIPKILITSCIVLALGGGTAWYFFGKHPEKAPEVTSVTVGRGDVTMVVTAAGDLGAVTNVEVSSQVSGLIQEVLVDYNTPVKQGTVLARLDPASYDQRLKQAQADLASTVANTQLTRLTTKRTHELYDKGLATDQDRDQADAQLAQAEAQFLTKQASLEDAKVNLSRCTIYAPIDGIVMQRAADVGKTVAASLNAPTLFIIANELANMQIIASVAEADIGNVQEGQQVTFRVDAYPNREFKGKVSQIRNYPKTTSNVVTYDTVIQVRNDDLKLKPGMTANVNIIVSQRRGTLRLPNSALRARVPETMLVVAKKIDDPKAPVTPAVKPLSEDERRKLIRQMMQKHGVSRESPPSPQQLEEIQAELKVQGVEMDLSRWGGGGKEKQAQQADAAPVVRTVYRSIPSDPLTPKAEAVSVKLGISDGVFTEIVDGLNENDLVITAVISSTSPSGASATANPFAGGMPRR